MTKDIDIKTFQAKLNQGRLDNPVTEDEAADACRNLGEFIALLYKINQREGIVPMEELDGTVVSNEMSQPIESRNDPSSSTPN